MQIEIENRFQIQLAPARVRWSASALLLCLLLGCAPVALPDGERRVALGGATEQVILPTYAELRARTADLASLLDELERTPAAADLEAIRQAYLDVRSPLEEAQAFGFGPAADLHSAAALDQTPIDTAKIDAELSADVELTPDHLRSLGANKRGLHAVEYLLFPADDAELKAALLADDVGGERRRRFASVAGQLVAESADQLWRAWAPESGDFARRFSEPGAADSVSPNVQSGLDTLLNEAVVLSEVVANVKLGKPLGIVTGGSIDPAAQESERAGASVSDMLGNLRGIRNVYLGAREGAATPSLATLVHAKSPGADLHAQAALADAEAALLAVPEPFSQALADSPETVQAAYEAMKSLKRVFATEVLSSLGASLKFSDNDGD
ncbi:MAG: imelysin family protein [Myxococcales bacterium]